MKRDKIAPLGCERAAGKARIEPPLVIDKYVPIAIKLEVVPVDLEPLHISVHVSRLKIATCLVHLGIERDKRALIEICHG